MSTFATQNVPLGLLERYRIVAPLGKGGMAEVFLAAWEVAPHVQRPVVIKRLYTHMGDDPGLVQMFIDEARLACGLEHDNIVKTIEVGVIDEQCCIAMEYLAGQPLQQLLRQNWGQGGLPIPVAVFVTMQALDALHYAHEAVDHRGMPLEIVHRDISPQNIFVTNNGHIKILDFGIAKAKSQQSRTATGYIKGKLAYIAPEQAQTLPVDRRADLWSVGVVLWEMLTGNRLFRADTDAATLTATLTASISPPSKYRHDIPSALDRIVMRALQRNVSLRYATALAMKRDLEKFLEKTEPVPDAASLANLMRQLFSEQITTQRRLVYDLLENGESFTMPTAASLTSTHWSPASSEKAIAQETSHVEGLIEQVTKSHKLVVRSLISAVIVIAVLGSVIVYILAMRLGQAVGAQKVQRANPKVMQVSGPPQPSMPSSVLPKPPVEHSDAIQAPTLRVTAASAPSAAAVNVTTSTRPPRIVERATGGRAKTAAEAPSVVVEYGYLSIDTTPWSIVSTNGKALGQTPLMGVKLPVGTHVLTLRNPDLGMETQYSVTIEAGKTLARRIGLQ